jgi:hypothetical protein
MREYSIHSNVCDLLSSVSIQYSVMVIRGNGVTLRTQKVIQGGDNGHVGRPCEVSLAPPCPERVVARFVT